MKINKKAISLLSIILAFSINTTNIFTDDSEFNKNSINNIKVKDVLNEEKIINIKKINIDSSGNPISSENVDLDGKSINLMDGVYTLDYGDGWVKGLDAGVLGTIIVQNGNKGIFSKNHTESFSHKISVQGSVSFTLSFVTSTIKAGYGHEWTEGLTSEIYKTITAPKDKNLFAKIQGVFRRVDVVRVKGGNIIDRAETYKPTSYAYRSLEFEEGEQLIQSKIYEKNANCILGDPGYDIDSIIDMDADYEGYANIKGTEYYWSTKYYNKNRTVGIYFTVPNDGRYEFKEEINSKTVVGGHPNTFLAHSGAQKSLYKVDPKNSSRVSFMASTPSNIKSYNIGTYMGNALTANLKSNEHYLLVFNSDKYQPALHDIPASNFSYRMRVRQLR